MQAFERHAFENYPITLAQMMQNAGKAVFDVVMNEIRPDGPVLVVAGKGNNGGDALVTARLLEEQGIDVTVFMLFEEDEFSEMARIELEKITHHPSAIKIQNLSSKTSVVEFSDASSDKYDLIIDAIFGFSLKGNPRLTEAKIIEQINYSNTPVLAVDVPSGLDVHDGSIGEPCIKADSTIAFGMLKKGFEEHPEFVGKIYLGDLGISKETYEDKGYEAPEFYSV